MKKSVALANRANRQGSALLTVLVTCVVISSVTAIALSMAMFRFRMIGNTVAMEQALAVAEGGAEIVVSRIAHSMATGAASPSSTGSGTVGGNPYTYNFVGDAIESVGTVRGVSRKVSIKGLGRGFWSKYLYFANYYNIPNANGTPGSKIWLISGDFLDGPVHCNHDIYITGSPVFADEVTLAGSIEQGGGYAPVFSNGAPQTVAAVDMQSIDFDILTANASAQGLHFVGQTDITVDGDVLTVVNNSTTNTYTVGSGANDIIYVANGSVPYGGTGTWQDEPVEDTISYWQPGYTVTNMTEGEWDSGTWIGGYEPTTGWYYRNGYTYKYTGYSSWRNDFIFRISGGWTYYTYTWRDRWVPEIVTYDGDEPDYKIEEHWEYDAKIASWASWDLCYMSSHRRYNWIPGEPEIVTVGSNLVSVTTNYTQKVWVEDTNATQNVNGDVSISGVLTEGLTVVAERNITVTGDLVYSNKPGMPVYTDAASDVMCGLIAGGDVVVANPNPYATEDRTIHASIMATGAKTGAAEGDPNGIDGRFIVQNYSKGAHKGTLYVYGGIIQNWRGPVGTFSSGGPKTGFLKNYLYDIRFGTTFGKAPPRCPLINVRFDFESWSEGPG